MGDRDWRPFVYGGIASCVAEFGELTCSNSNIISGKFSEIFYDLVQ